MSSNKILFVCSDTTAFTYDSKYRLKDKYRVYDSHENEELKEDDKKNKLLSCNLIIIDVINNKNDLKLLNNLNEFKKIGVLRNHESRSVGWVNNAFLKCDAICKFKDQALLTDFKDIDSLIKNLQAVELDVEGDWRFYAKKLGKWLLFCLNQSN
jgi:hypothetical protein